MATTPSLLSLPPYHTIYYRDVVCLYSINLFLKGPCIQDLQQIPALTVFDTNLDLLQEIMLPLAENRRSDGTEVAGMAR